LRPNRADFEGGIKQQDSGKRIALALCHSPAFSTLSEAQQTREDRRERRSLAALWCRTPR
jgi:hypothetical protein